MSQYRATRRSTHGVSQCTILFIISLTVGCGFRLPGYNKSEFPVLAGYKVYRYSGNFITVEDQESIADTATISKKVVELGHDETFIIAKQQEFTSRIGDQSAELIPDQFKYWIVNAKTHEIWGPLEIEQFAAKREDLGVDAAVKLRDVKSYFK